MWNLFLGREGMKTTPSQRRSCSPPGTNSKGLYEELPSGMQVPHTCTPQKVKRINCPGAQCIPNGYWKWQRIMDPALKPETKKILTQTWTCNLHQVYLLFSPCLVWILFHLFMLPLAAFEMEAVIDSLSGSHSLYIEGSWSIKIDR